MEGKGHFLSIEMDRKLKSGHGFGLLDKLLEQNLEMCIKNIDEFRSGYHGIDTWDLHCIKDGRINALSHDEVQSFEYDPLDGCGDDPEFPELELDEGRLEEKHGRILYFPADVFVSKKFIDGRGVDGRIIYDISLEQIGVGDKGLFLKYADARDDITQKCINLVKSKSLK